MKRLQILFLLPVLALRLEAAAVETPADLRQKKALEVLRQIMLEQAKTNATSATRTNAPTVRQPTFAEMEQYFLSGKISARQYQTYLNSPTIPPAAKRPPVVTNAPAAAATSVRPTAPRPAVNPGDASEDAASKKALSEVEAKMDELLRLKAAREKAAETNAAAATAVPKTKRERLNAILRLFVDEKISEKEYNEQRAKITAEPE